MLYYSAFLSYSKPCSMQSQRGKMGFRLFWRQEVSQSCLFNCYYSKIQSSIMISINERLALVFNSQVRTVCVIHTNGNPLKCLCYTIYHQLIFSFFIHYYITISTCVTMRLCHMVLLWHQLFFQLLIDKNLKSLPVRCIQMI